MNVVRMVLVVAAFYTLGYALVALFLLGLRDFGIGVAVAAALWILVELTRVMEDRR